MKYIFEISIFVIFFVNFQIGVSEEAQTGISSTGQEHKSEGVQAGGTLSASSGGGPTTKSSSTNTRSSAKDHMHHVLTSAKSIDYGDMDMVIKRQICKVSFT